MLCDSIYLVRNIQISNSKHIDLKQNKIDTTTSPYRIAPDRAAHTYLYRVLFILFIFLYWFDFSVKCFIVLIVFFFFIFCFLLICDLSLFDFLFSVWNYHLYFYCCEMWLLYALSTFVQFVSDFIIFESKMFCFDLFLSRKNNYYLNEIILIIINNHNQLLVFHSRQNKTSQKIPFTWHWWRLAGRAFSKKPILIWKCSKSNLSWPEANLIMIIFNNNRFEKKTRLAFNQIYQIPFSIILSIIIIY